MAAMVVISVVGLSACGGKKPTKPAALATTPPATQTTETPAPTPTPAAPPTTSAGPAVSPLTGLPGATGPILAVKIDPEVAGDVEMLQYMILAAAGEAMKKVEEQIQGKMGGMLGGMGLTPGMF